MLGTSAFSVRTEFSVGTPWQNAYVERLIGSIRRECLDHVVVLSNGHLRRLLKGYIGYYHRSRTTFGVKQGCARATGDHAARRDHRDTASGRVAPPL
jgi:transposase InsO family protein